MSINSITGSSFSYQASSVSVTNDKGTVKKESVSVSVSVTKTAVSGDSFLPSDRVEGGAGVFGGYAPAGLPKSLRGLWGNMLGYSETTATTQAEKARYASMSFEELAKSIGMGTTPEAAAAAISEDGLWGVNAVSTRLMDMAMSLSKGDPELAEELRAAVQKGFEAVGDISSLPQVCQDTYTETMTRFDYWAENGSLEGYGETDVGKYEMRLSGMAYNIGAIKAQKDGSAAYDKLLEVKESFETLTEGWRTTVTDREDPAALRQLDDARIQWVTNLRDNDPAGFRAWVEIHIAPNARNGGFENTIKPADFTLEDMRQLLSKDIMEYESGTPPTVKDILGIEMPEKTTETGQVNPNANSEPGVYTIDRLVTADYFSGKDKTNEASLTFESENVLFYKMPDGRTVPVLASQLRKEAAEMDAAGTGMINGRSRTEAVEDFLKDKETVVEVFRLSPGAKNWEDAEFKLHGATFTYSELEAAQTFMEKLGTALRENGSASGALDYDDYANMGLGESKIRAFGKEQGFSDEQVEALLTDYRNTLNEVVQKNFTMHSFDTQETHLPHSEYFLMFRTDQDFDFGDRTVEAGTLATAPDVAVNWDMIRDIYETMARVDLSSMSSFESALKGFMDDALEARMAGTIDAAWARWRVGVYEENIRKFQTAMNNLRSAIEV